MNQKLTNLRVSPTRDVRTIPITSDEPIRTSRSGRPLRTTTPWWRTGVLNPTNFQTQHSIQIASDTARGKKVRSIPHEQKTKQSINGAARNPFELSPKTSILPSHPPLSPGTKRSPLRKVNSNDCQSAIDIQHQSGSSFHFNVPALSNTKTGSTFKSFPFSRHDQFDWLDETPVHPQSEGMHPCTKASKRLRHKRSVRVPAAIPSESGTDSKVIGTPRKNEKGKSQNRLCNAVENGMQRLTEHVRRTSLTEYSGCSTRQESGNIGSDENNTCILSMPDSSQQGDESSVSTSYPKRKQSAVHARVSKRARYPLSSLGPVPGHLAAYADGRKTTIEVRRGFDDVVRDALSVVRTIAHS